jgi:uncharacterized phage protein (TIGR01671 family)
MNLPLKFRAWDKTEKKMWSVVGISYMKYDAECEGEPEWKITDEIQEVAVREIGTVGITFEKPLWLPISRFVLMQFTGLYDKNDLPIYEKDIVKLSHNRVPFVVEFRRSSWVLSQPDGDLPFVSTLNINKRSGEVIGNIYSTPKLLNK